MLPFSDPRIRNRITVQACWQAATALIKTIVYKRHVPLFASFNITFHCDQSCSYCGSWQPHYTELDTNDCKQAIKCLYKRGARWLTISGGEPLLRKDIGEIIHYAKDRGFKVFVSTNGNLLPERIKEIARADKINLSLDGTRDSHDIVRGIGAYDRTLNAIQICQHNHIPVGIQCTLNKYNLHSTASILDLAAQFGIWVMFQPATHNLDSSVLPNPICPQNNDYKHTVNQLIDLKRKGALISNSITGLKHLANWPEPTAITCSAGRFFCVVEPNGMVLACHQAQIKKYLLHHDIHVNVLDQTRRMEIPKGCHHCWCAPLVEINLLFALRLNVIFNTIKTNRLQETR